MTVFKIHHEGSGYSAAEAFLAGWLPAAIPHMYRLFGLPEPDRIHVFLSDRATHERRFPQREDELLLNTGGELPAEDIPLHVETYAHGVAHPTHRKLGLPTGVADGEPAIFLDCETLSQLAEEISVEFEPVLGRTALHELAHILRGHATEDGRRTHGFAREGDAQRDAWAVLGSMLSDSATRATALAGRAAQVRLANSQPRAYTMFGQDSADRHHWQHSDPESGIHLIRTPRNLLAIVKQNIVECPVRTVLGPVPQVGDLVYLAQERDDRDYFVVGPWVVLDREREAVAMSEKDAEEVARANQRDRPGSATRRTFEYLVLRPSKLRAARAIDMGKLPPMGLVYGVGAPGEWLEHLGDDPEAVFAEVREERRLADAAAWQRLSEELGRELRPSDWVYDPDAD